jgi:hypothetical protein
VITKLQYALEVFLYEMLGWHFSLGDSYFVDRRNLGKPVMKGHADDAINKRADELANAAAA